MIRGFIRFFLFIVLGTAIAASSALASAQITGVRHWSAPDHTRFVFDVCGEITYNSFTLTDPDRFVIDLKNVSARFQPTTIPVHDAVVKQVRFGYFNKDTFRVVCDLQRPAKASIFALEKVQGKSERFVFDLVRPELSAQSEEARQQISKESGSKKIIVLDPGHGGEDPGAIGPAGTKEKNVVLEFARSLKELFSRRQDCEVFLTRNGDYFLSLRERTKIAEDYGADLFISIHADSNRNRKIKGSSVYCLSLQGASDKAARCLAEQENEADLVGGVPFTQNHDLNFMLLDLALTSTINASLRYGSLVLREINKVHSIKFEEPRQAGFVVLKTAEIPSVLVEIGFLSNPVEEKKLNEQTFRSSVGAAIVAASINFLSHMAQSNHEPSLPLSVNTAGEPQLLHQQ